MKITFEVTPDTVFAVVRTPSTRTRLRVPRQGSLEPEDYKELRELLPREVSPGPFMNHLLSLMIPNLK